MGDRGRSVRVLILGAALAVVAFGCTWWAMAADAQPTQAKRLVMTIDDTPAPESEKPDRGATCLDRVEVLVAERNALLYRLFQITAACQQMHDELQSCLQDESLKYEVRPYVEPEAGEDGPYTSF